MNPPKILCADDHRDVLEALRLVLSAEGFSVELTSSPAAALEAVRTTDFAAALLDLNYARDTTSGTEGFDLLGKILSIDVDLPVVLMTAWGTVEGAVQAIKRGAKDYVQKPWDNTRLIATIRTHVALSTEIRRSRRLSAENRLLRSSSGTWLGDAPSMTPVATLVHRISSSDANVVITGEHGTGKEVVARAIHGLSERAAGPFIAVNSAGLPDALFESEMFGHTKGAFTDAKSDRIGAFELAEQGTLFLDEIGAMPIVQQAKLLRALQTSEFRPVGASRVRKVDIRVVAATNVDLVKAVAEQRFREDLLFRLNTIEIHVPPLRERTPDILSLAALFLSRVKKRYSRPALELSMEAQEALIEYRWPGNVRELEHVIERATLLAIGTEIKTSDLRLSGAEPPRSLDEMTLEEVEVALIKKALARAGGNVSDAARALGISRSAMYRRLAGHGLSPSK